MAVMWPRQLPRDVLRNSLRRSECEVYRQLDSELDASFVVFYSSPWLGLKPDGEEIDGECDFTVAHARLGILTIEVKGGAVRYDPGTEQWMSTDRNGIDHYIKNPVAQAKSAKHELLAKLKRSRRWVPRFIQARHGVILPDSSRSPADLGADMPRRIFCFYEEFKDGLREWIERRFGDAPPDGGRVRELGRDGLRALEDLLAKPFELRTPLGAHLSRDDQELEILTQQQCQILRSIGEYPRVAISGGAGTGKTVLAIEEARRWAEGGARTLFVCYNRGLALDVRKRLERVAPVSVMTFHQLCREMVGRAELDVPRSQSQSELLDEIYPDLLVEAFDRLPGERFDAIIVDEGQDFLPYWWAALDAGLDPDGKRILRIFHDSNQRLYPRARNLPEEVDSIPYPLTWNLRNTQRVHEVVSRHYRGREIQPLGPEGVDVEWISVSTDRNIRQSVESYVARLVGSEKVGEQEIAILVSRKQAIGEFAPHDRFGRFTTARCDEPAEGRIILDTIRRFKGLERPVVIVAATPDTVASEEIPYVALSRARTHLAVVGKDRVLQRMRKSVDPGPCFLTA